MLSYLITGQPSLLKSDRISGSGCGRTVRLIFGSRRILKIAIQYIPSFLPTTKQLLNDLESDYK